MTFVVLSFCCDLLLDTSSMIEPEAYARTAGVLLLVFCVRRLSHAVSAVGVSCLVYELL